MIISAMESKETSNNNNFVKESTQEEQEKITALDVVLTKEFGKQAAYSEAQKTFAQEKLQHMQDAFKQYNDITLSPKNVKFIYFLAAFSDVLSGNLSGSTNSILKEFKEFLANYNNAKILCTQFTLPSTISIVNRSPLYIGTILHHILMSKTLSDHVKAILIQGIIDYFPAELLPELLQQSDNFNLTAIELALCVSSADILYGMLSLYQEKCSQQFELRIGRNLDDIDSVYLSIDSTSYIKKDDCQVHNGFLYLPLNVYTKIVQVLFNNNGKQNPTEFINKENFKQYFISIYPYLPYPTNDTEMQNFEKLCSWLEYKPKPMFILEDNLTPELQKSFINNSQQIDKMLKNGSLNCKENIKLIIKIFKAVPNNIFNNCNLLIIKDCIEELSNSKNLDYEYSIRVGTQLFTAIYIRDNLYCKNFADNLKYSKVKGVGLSPSIVNLKLYSNIKQTGFKDFAELFDFLEKDFAKNEDPKDENPKDEDPTNENKKRLAFSKNEFIAEIKKYPAFYLEYIKYRLTNITKYSELIDITRGFTSEYEEAEVLAEFQDILFINAIVMLEIFDNKTFYNLENYKHFFPNATFAVGDNLLIEYMKNADKYQKHHIEQFCRIFDKHLHELFKSFAYNADLIKSMHLLSASFSKYIDEKALLQLYEQLANKTFDEKALNFDALYFIYNKIAYSKNPEMLKFKKYIETKSFQGKCFMDYVADKDPKLCFQLYKQGGLFSDNKKLAACFQTLVVTTNLITIKEILSIQGFENSERLELLQIMLDKEKYNIAHDEFKDLFTARDIIYLLKDNKNKNFVRYLGENDYLAHINLKELEAENILKLLYHFNAKASSKFITKEVIDFILEEALKQDKFEFIDNLRMELFQSVLGDTEVKKYFIEKVAAFKFKDDTTYLDRLSKVTDYNDEFIKRLIQNNTPCKPDKLEMLLKDLVKYIKDSEKIEFFLNLNDQLFSRADKIALLERLSAETLKEKTEEIAQFFNDADELINIIKNNWDFYKKIENLLKKSIDDNVWKRLSEDSFIKFFNNPGKVKGATDNRFEEGMLTRLGYSLKNNENIEADLAKRLGSSNISKYPDKRLCIEYLLLARGHIEANHDLSWFITNLIAVGRIENILNTSDKFDKEIVLQTTIDFLEKNNNPLINKLLLEIFQSDPKALKNYKLSENVLSGFAAYVENHTNLSTHQKLAILTPIENKNGLKDSSGSIIDFIKSFHCKVDEDDFILVKADKRFKNIAEQNPELFKVGAIIIGSRLDHEDRKDLAKFIVSDSKLYEECLKSVVKSEDVLVRSFKLELEFERENQKIEDSNKKAEDKNVTSTVRVASLSLNSKNSKNSAKKE